MDDTKSHEKLKYRITKIKQKCKELKLKDGDIIKLKSYQKLQTTSVIWKIITGLIVSALLVSLLGCGVLYTSWNYDFPVTQETLVRAYIVDYNGNDLDQETCMVPLQDEVWDWTRAPTNCDFCRGLEEIPRVANLSTEEFVAKYAYSSVPVVITDATDDWKARQTFSLDYFRSIYSEEALRKQGQFCNFVPYSREFGSLKEALNMDEREAKCHGRVRPGGEDEEEDDDDGDNDPWYFGWGNCASSDVANILRTQYTTPYFLPNTTEMTRVDWIFMGCPGYGAIMHVDSVRKPSWQAMITGRKRWILEPPGECYFQCKEKLEVVLEKGDLFIVDTNTWWHGTKVLGNEIAIAIGSEYD